MKGKTRLAIGLAAVGVCGVMRVAQLHAESPTMHTVSERQRHVTATVEEIDKDKRRVTLSDKAGEKTSIDVPENIKAFDKLKVGDKVNVGYYDSLAVALQKPGDKPSNETRQVETTTPGKGKTRVEQTDVTAEITAVDTKKHQVTVKGPEGQSRTVTVDDPTLREKLPSLKPGQTVQMVYTQAVAASIEPSKK